MVINVSRKPEEKPKFPAVFPNGSYLQRKHQPNGSILLKLANRYFWLFEAGAVEAEGGIEATDLITAPDGWIAVKIVGIQGVPA